MHNLCIYLTAKLTLVTLDDADLFPEPIPIWDFLWEVGFYMAIKFRIPYLMTERYVVFNRQPCLLTGNIISEI